MHTALQYLAFDSSEDDHGHGSFDAMASVPATQLDALESEVLRVLDWGEARFGPAGALDEASEWDFELQGVRELATQLDVHYTPGAAQLELKDGAAAPPRITLSLTVSGTPSFCAAFRQAFGL